ncbi:MAG: DEAD/DEAH box helicase [Anaerolineae bacterium]|nr:DEAD/DEAH box helicase [Anaerolineae bacterium]
MAAALLNGQQAALMAPTSILAEQHYQKLSALFTQLPGLEGVQIALLTSGLSAAERRAAYDGLASGMLQAVVGTHAVIQGDLQFSNLALAVIDEQHRFGVEQRGALRGKGTNPHLLVMSATPIPRTLALTRHADLDLSVLDEMPPGRTPIRTKLLNLGQRPRAYEFIVNHVLSKGHQAYIIYPLVEESDAVEAESAVAGFERLQAVFPGYQLGLMHGRLGQAEKKP